MKFSIRSACMALAVSALLVTGCSSSDEPNSTNSQPTDNPEDAVTGGLTPVPDPNIPDTSTPGDITSPDSALDLAGPASWYTQDGYDTVDVIRLDIRTVTTAGVCTVDDDSGCTLADVIADIDGDDDFTVDIPIHYTADEYPEDGLITNSELRQRGGFTRLAPQKSFRIKLDSKTVLWRNERRLQLNKMPYDQSRMRNKLSFDLMVGVPHLSSLRTQFVNLWIDDGQGPQDYGLFTHTEYAGPEYLANRGRSKDDSLYKAGEFIFDQRDLDNMQIDALGAPLDEDRFEASLGIQNGEDHRKVVEMIKAVNNNSQAFETTMERYFDEENVLTWVAINFLLNNLDAVTHNFYLYNPAGTDKFYFLPWDYDGTFDVEQQPANSFASEELTQRLFYGYSKGRSSKFLSRFYQQPGIHQKVLAKADELRNNQFMDSNINERASRYASVISPYASRKPDIDFNASYFAGYSSTFAGNVALNYDALLNYGIPLPPTLSSPVVESNQVRFKWEAALDMNGNAITYDLEISSSPAFESDNSLFVANGISEDNRTGYNIDINQIGSGKRYVRLVARVTTNPQSFWQIANNRTDVNGAERIGVMEFSVP